MRQNHEIYSQRESDDMEIVENNFIHYLLQLGMCGTGYMFIFSRIGTGCEN